MLSTARINFFWFRRDLRIQDNHGLYRALGAGLPVLCVFIFDETILSRLGDPADRRVSFIYRQILSIRKEIEGYGSSLITRYGKPVDVISAITDQWNTNAVFANEDYEPEAIHRDNDVAKILSEKSVGFHLFKDQVIFSKNDIVKPNGESYTIFTPYSRKWLSGFEADPDILKPFPSQKIVENFLQLQPEPILSLETIGFKEVDPGVPPLKDDPEMLRQYARTRDKLYADGTSHASVYLRFGTISIRDLVKKAQLFSRTYLSELIWREFFQAILFHFPKVGEGASFKPAYDYIEWRNNEEEFKKWCEGKTGYPVVDAGMRELSATGYMHNRARMITASFLCKHLLIDWRWGEAWFAEKLLDYDLAANNGGWQWASGSGCDAAPYFRIFNPYTQQQKFDPNLAYVRKWIPEFGSSEYPLPLVNHDLARKRCLEVYKKALQKEDF